MFGSLQCWYHNANDERNDMTGEERMNQWDWNELGRRERNSLQQWQASNVRGGRHAAPSRWSELRDSSSEQVGAPPCARVSLCVSTCWGVRVPLCCLSLVSFIERSREYEEANVASSRWYANLLDNGTHSHCHLGWIIAIIIIFSMHAVMCPLNVIIHCDIDTHALGACSITLQTSYSCRGNARPS